MKLVNVQVIKDELARLIRNYRFYSSTEAKYRYEAYKELSEWLDELNITDVDAVEREVKKDAGGYPYISATELYDAWLKFIRPQNRWKPSDVQIECLSDAIEHYNSLGYPAPKLKELLDDLKKLKEGNV